VFAHDAWAYAQRPAGLSAKRYHRFTTEAPLDGKLMTAVLEPGQLPGGSLVHDGFFSWNFTASDSVVIFWARALS